ncbi:hypothetical protein HK097_010315 [Rhizophlyctis rosea]|uniref:Uncharacterized protein n=1 Tax=Rhizophlyctis rosea TaxID=64517 RepID=A0AAD5WZU8_9FUNG|nr:hypothetical protein HK097_010315 [Rhizophlyctis rosea]
MGERLVLLNRPPHIPESSTTTFAPPARQKHLTNLPTKIRKRNRFNASTAKINALKRKVAGANIPEGTRIAYQETIEIWADWVEAKIGLENPALLWNFVPNAEQLENFIADLFYEEKDGDDDVPHSAAKKFTGKTPVPAFPSTMETEELEQLDYATQLAEECSALHEPIVRAEADCDAQSQQDSSKNIIPADSSSKNSDQQDSDNENSQQANIASGDDAEDEEDPEMPSCRKYHFTSIKQHVNRVLVLLRTNCPSVRAMPQPELYAFFDPPHALLAELRSYDKEFSTSVYANSAINHSDFVLMDDDMSSQLVEALAHDRRGAMRLLRDKVAFQCMHAHGVRLSSVSMNSIVKRGERENPRPTPIYGFRAGSVHLEYQNFNGDSGERYFGGDIRYTFLKTITIQNPNEVLHIDIPYYGKQKNSLGLSLYMFFERRGMFAHSDALHSGDFTLKPEVLQWPVLCTLSPSGQLLNQEPAPSTAFSKTLKETAERVGIDPKIISPKALRKGFLRQSESRVGAALTRRMAGHAPKSVTLVMDMWNDDLSCLFTYAPLFTVY